MKIMDNFDTKLDEKELLSAIQEHGEGNAILTKKHRWFLMKPLGWLLFSLVAFGVLLWFVYYHYFVDYPVLFWIVCSAYGAVTLFWIIHSLTVLFQCIKNNCIFVDTVKQQNLKSWSFESYIKHSMISLILQAVILIGNLLLVVFFKGGGDFSWLVIILEFILNIIFLWIIVITIYDIIDYEMDFNIFTPKQFRIYRQHGLFKASSTSIATSTIKMVKEENTSIIWSFFGFGNISIHPEGNTDAGPVGLHYVTKPKILVKKMNEFIDESKKMINIPVAS